MVKIAGTRKRCNQLDGKTWTRYSISVWNDIKKSPGELRLNHPAAFPLELAERCIQIFTSGPGELVLDPFAGTGTTLIAAARLGRCGVGTELYPHYLELFRERLAAEGEGAAAGGLAPPPRLYQDDARHLKRYLKKDSVDFVLTSPPYWDILTARRTADRKEQRCYGDREGDLGLTEDYALFLQQLGEVFGLVGEVLKAGRYLAVVVMDLRKKNRFYPLHMDLARVLQERGFTLDDLIIWDRRHEYNNLRPLGYPSVFRVNKVHEYLLLFKK
ncbi:MAG: site-specific DNA-methyltransferase [Dethiobacteria bacterium]